MEELRELRIPPSDRDPDCTELRRLRCTLLTVGLLYKTKRQALCANSHSQLVWHAFHVPCSVHRHGRRDPLSMLYSNKDFVAFLARDPSRTEKQA